MADDCAFLPIQTRVLEPDTIAEGKVALIEAINAAFCKALCNSQIFKDAAFFVQLRFDSH